MLEARTSDPPDDGFVQPTTLISYTYDRVGNRLTFGGPEATSAVYAYDTPLRRLASIANGLDETFTFHYDELSRRTGLTLPNDTVAAYAYDVAGQLLSLTHALTDKPEDPFLSFAYDHDKVGNIQQITEREHTTVYECDPTNQLTDVTPIVGDGEFFRYDAVGNRLTSNTSNFHFHDEANRLLEDETFLYGYDLKGNLISKEHKKTHDTSTYTYDPENRLVQVDLPDATIAKYRYDALGRRIERDVDGAITRHVYDGEDILVEYDGNDTAVRAYTHGPGIDEPLSLHDIKAAESFVYHVDHLGSIREMTDALANVSQRNRYSSFGTLTERLDKDFVQPFAFTSRELDPETGIYHFRARSHDSSIGRFIIRDPVFGSLRFPLGRNAYTYVRNNPLLFADLSGLTVFFFGGDVEVGVIGVGSVGGGVVYDPDSGVVGFRVCGGLAVGAGAFVGVQADVESGSLTRGINAGVSSSTSAQAAAGIGLGGSVSGGISRGLAQCDAETVLGASGGLRFGAGASVSAGISGCVTVGF